MVSENQMRMLEEELVALRDRAKRRAWDDGHLESLLKITDKMREKAGDSAISERLKIIHGLLTAVRDTREGQLAMRSAVKRFKSVYG